MADVVTPSAPPAESPVPVPLPTKPTKLEMSPEDSSISTVTVFADRAEVTRALDTKLATAGRYEVVFTRLPASLVPDSVRVKGTGDIRILEVSFDVRHRTVDPPSSSSSSSSPDDHKSEAERLTSHLEDLRAQRSRLEQERGVHNKTLSALSVFVDAAINKKTAVTDLEYIASTLDMHETRTTAGQAAVRALDVKIRDLSKSITEAQTNLARLGEPTFPTTRQSREVTVLLDSGSDDTAAHLDLTYVVNKASWTPAYDVRVDSEGQSVETTYFGNIKQSSGEDWKDTRLVLSTAQPTASGGVAPTLPSRRIHIFTPVTVSTSRRMKKGASFACGGASAQKERSYSRRNSYMENAELEEDSWGGEAAPAVDVATSRVEHGAVASVFLIDRIGSIDSDNKPHKVTIAVIPMESMFRHFCAPSASTRCYLQANVINSSDYAMLPSSKVNVFFGDAFVGSTSLPRVSPGEKFRCSLGPDPAIKVDFRDLGKKASTKGYFSKADIVAQEFQTTITNDKSVPVEVVLVAQLPKSMHGSIEIKAVTPSEAALEAGTKVAKEQGDINTADDAAVGDLVMAVAEAAMPDASNGIRRRGKARTSAGAGGSGDRSASTAVVRNPLTNNIVWALNVASHESATIPFEYTIKTTGGYNASAVKFYED